MIFLDTNVISEMMKKLPDAKVMAWVDQHKAAELFITTITIAEIEYGINILPEGNHKYSIETSFNKTVKDAFKHRIFSFDEPAAHLYGSIMSNRKKIGRPLSVLDGQIAAIALAHGAAIATRNIRDFVDCHLTLINPFE